MSTSTQKPIELINQLIHGLQPSEKQMLIRKLNMGFNSVNDLLKSNRMEKENACVKCGCLHIVKFGTVARYRTLKNSEGEKIGRDYIGEHQRYKCKDCGATFVSTAKSVFYRSHMSPDQMSEYVRCLLEQDSIRKSARKCEISSRTSFRWRHKILDTITIPNEKTILGGVVEADETGFDLSFKGNMYNHLAFYGMYAPEYRKWLKDHPNKTPMAMNGMVNVCCGIDHNHEVIATPTNLGKCRMKHIEAAFDNRIEKRTIMCTDKNPAYKRVCEKMDLGLLMFKSDDRKTKSGYFNIQRINSYHSNLKQWFKPFRGVATKYLRNYLLWYNFVWFNGKLSDTDKFFEHLANVVFDEKIIAVQNRAAIPFSIRKV